MKKSIGLGLAAAMTWSVMARAETPRTLRVREDQRPGAGQLEVSVAGDMAERTSPVYPTEKIDEIQTSAQLRYGLSREFTLNAAVPFVSRETASGDRESGIGDVRLGFELVTWRDTYEYPWIMPYAEVAFPTGNEDKGLGTGDVTGALGIAMGSTAVRYTHFVLDFRYLYVPDGDNVFSGGLAMIHDLSKQFAVSIEGVIREKMAGEDDTPTQLIGGMTYKPAPSVAISVFVGKEFADEDSTVAGARVSYTFK